MGAPIALILIGSVLYAYATNAVVTAAVLASTVRQSTPLVLFGRSAGCWASAAA